MDVVDLVAAVVAVVGCFAFVGYVIREAVRGAPERRAEEEAREFLTRHGHWPDEPAPRH